MFTTQKCPGTLYCQSINLDFNVYVETAEENDNWDKGVDMPNWWNQFWDSARESKVNRSNITGKKLLKALVSE